jgi:TPP-dependent pyruvate/acetoin dehydrogenase alpha subunit
MKPDQSRRWKRLPARLPSLRVDGQSNPSTPSELQRSYKAMLRTRVFEDAAQRLFLANEIEGSIHSEVRSFP